MKRLLVLSVVFVTVWSFLISMMMVIGYTTQTAHRDALLTGFGLNSCEQACWHGLQIDKTILGEAANTLQLDATIKVLDPDPHSTCQFHWAMTIESADWTGDACVHGEIIREIYLRTNDPNSGFTTGDALAIWGAPESIVCSNYVPDATSYSAITLAYKSGMAISIVRSATRENMLFDPTTPINRIFYEQHVGFISQYVHPWRGFVSRALFKPGYCQQQTP